MNAYSTNLGRLFQNIKLLGRLYILKFHLLARSSNETIKATDRTSFCTNPTCYFHGFSISFWATSCCFCCRKCPSLINVSCCNPLKFNGFSWGFSSQSSGLSSFVPSFSPRSIWTSIWSSMRTLRSETVDKWSLEVYRLIVSNIRWNQGDTKQDKSLDPSPNL